STTHGGLAVYGRNEPNAGLHLANIEKLLEVLNRLVERKNTVVVIEHNLDVVKGADHVIDLGPEGGAGGGQVVAAGTPEAISKIEASYTGQYLKKMLETKKQP
ncbi:MAG: excinuclease ABC subunit UvrA, partial [Deltaproteobacteria bacterium]|nr:excinuclease ABC subunit UvrA [Deltaproteobacteria bacterium]